MIPGASLLGFWSLLAFGTYLVLSLFLSIGVSSAGAVDDGGGSGAAGGLFRLENGMIVIDWSPGVGFRLNSTDDVKSLNTTGMENESLNASFVDPGAENGSSDLNATSAPLSLDETGLFGGALTGAGLAQFGSSNRPAEYGRRVTDLVGVFSVEMTIKLGSNQSSLPGTAEWIPCP